MHRMNSVGQIVGWVAAALCFGTSALHAQNAQQVWRCGNAYTNQPDPTQHCVALRAAPVTVIEGTKNQAILATTAASSAALDEPAQKQRDAQARLVLENELQKAQQRHADLLSEWRQGEPERRPDEAKQAAKYQERVEQLRQSLARSQADIAGLERELARSKASSQGMKP